MFPPFPRKSLSSGDSDRGKPGPWPTRLMQSSLPGTFEVHRERMHAQELLVLGVSGSGRTGGLRDVGGGVRRGNREREGGKGGPEWTQVRRSSRGQRQSHTAILKLGNRIIPFPILVSFCEFSPSAPTDAKGGGTMSGHFLSSPMQWRVSDCLHLVLQITGARPT